MFTFNWENSRMFFNIVNTHRTVLMVTLLAAGGVSGFVFAVHYYLPSAMERLKTMIGIFFQSMSDTDYDYPAAADTLQEDSRSETAVTAGVEKTREDIVTVTSEVIPETDKSEPAREILPVWY